MTLDEYNKLKESGMMWELHPGFTGVYDYDLRERNFIARWKTHEFEPGPSSYDMRIQRDRGQVVYARSVRQVNDMIKQIDPHAHMIKVSEYEETE